MALKNQPQFWQRKMIRHGGGVYNFADPGNKVLYTWAQPNDAWLFDSTDNILATVDSVVTRAVFGNADSVKVISLSNGRTVELSEHYGLLRFPQDDTTDAVLVGIDGRGLGVLMPTFVSLFGLQMPDTLCYSGQCVDGSSGPFCPYDYDIPIAHFHKTTRVLLHQQILIGDSVFEYPHSDIQVHTVYWDFNCNEVGSTTTECDTCTWTVYKPPLLSYFYCNSLFVTSFGNYSIVSLSKDNWGRITLGAGYSLQTLNSCFSCNDTLISTYYAYYGLSYVQGIGFGGEDHGYFEYSCSRGYTGVCAPYNVGIATVPAKDTELKISPVPAHDYANIETNSDKPIQATIVNTLGQERTKLTIDKHAILDMSTFPSGVYFLLAETPNGYLHKMIIKD